MIFFNWFQHKSPKVTRLVLGLTGHMGVLTHGKLVLPFCCQLQTASFSHSWALALAGYVFFLLPLKSVIIGIHFRPFVIQNAKNRPPGIFCISHTSIINTPKFLFQTFTHMFLWVRRGYTGWSYGLSLITHRYTLAHIYTGLQGWGAKHQYGSTDF